MSAAKFVAAVELEQVVCGNCGGTYAVASRVVTQYREKGGYWHCPYCQCSWGYSRGDSELERAKKAAEAERQRHQATLSRLNELEAKAKRAATRTKNGVCPCCNRTFTALQRHIKAKHPEFKP